MKVEYILNNLGFSEYEYGKGEGSDEAEGKSKVRQDVKEYGR